MYFLSQIVAMIFETELASLLSEMMRIAIPLTIALTLHLCTKATSPLTMCLNIPSNSFVRTETTRFSLCMSVNNWGTHQEHAFFFNEGFLSQYRTLLIVKVREINYNSVIVNQRFSRIFASLVPVNHLFYRNIHLNSSHTMPIAYQM